MNENQKILSNKIEDETENLENLNLNKNMQNIKKI